MKNKVYSIPKAKTFEEFIARIRSAYKELPQQMLKNSIGSIQTRLEKCIELHGGHIEKV